MAENSIEIRESALTDEVLSVLIEMSKAWQAESVTHGYFANTRADIEGNRIFLAYDGWEVVGYLFGHEEKAERDTTVMAAGTPYFEVMELYVKPERRSRGIGQRLMAVVEEAVRGGAEFIVLSTATKNARAILHFYIDEVGMEFWSARLFKKID